MYQAFDLGNGREAIRCSSGRTCHIVRQEDNTWIVEEDERQAIFLNRESALDCAREIAGDPDLPPLTLIQKTCADTETRWPGLNPLQPAIVFDANYYSVPYNFVQELFVQLWARVRMFF